MGLFDWLGTSNTNQTQTQQTTPWGPAAGALSGILGGVGGINPNLTGAETGAFNQLSANAGNGPSQFYPGISSAATSMLAGGGANDQSPMINDAYKRYIDATNPYASGGMSGIDSPQMAAVLAKIRGDVGDSVNGMFAASGRDASGYNQQTLARGISQGEAEPLFNQMNQDTQNRIAAITGQFGAGTTAGGILSGFNQNANANKVQGTQMADLATQAQNYGPMQQLAIEAQRRGIPLQTMAQQAGIVLPAAQAFGTTTGNTQGTTTASPAQVFGQMASGWRSLYGKPLGQ